MAEPITYEQMSDLFRSQNQMFANMMNKSSAGGAAGGGGANTGGFNAALNGLTGGISGSLSAVTKFTSGTYKAADALSNMEQISGLVGGNLGKTLGSIGKQVGEGTILLNESLKASSQEGAYFGNNLGLYNKAVLGARMSMPEWEQTIKQNSKSLAGLGVNMDVSSLAFLKIGKKVQEQDIAYQLQVAGVGSEEFGKVLTLVAHNSRQSDMTQIESRKKMIESAITLAKEMDNTARITGISRQEQQESLERQLKSKESELAMLAMSDEERSAYEKNLAQTKRYGDSVQEAIKIYSTGGPMNADETQKIVALGPEMADAARRLSEVKGTSADDEKKREAIKAEMDAIVLRKQGDKAFAEEQMRLYKAGDAQTKAMAQSQLEQIRYAQVLKRQQEEAQRMGISLAEYQKTEQAKVDANLKAGAEGKPGTEGDAAVLSQTMNKVDIGLKQVSSAVGEGVNSLNKEIGKTISGFEGVNKVLKNWTTEEVVKVPQKLVDAISKQLGVEKPIAVPEKEAAKKPKMFGGTMGAFGELLHDFGKETTVDLHGKEAVLNEKQLSGMIGNMQGMMSEGISQAKSSMPSQAELSSAFGGLSSNLENLKSSMPSADTLGNMFGNLQNSLKTELEKAKSAMPTQESMRGIINQMQNTMPKIQESVTGSGPSQSSAVPVDEVMNSMSKGIEELNKRIERLINAVEEGSDKSVRAFKTQGNLIA